MAFAVTRHAAIYVLAMKLWLKLTPFPAYEGITLTHGNPPIPEIGVHR
jgi:hypothetical protein